MNITNHNNADLEARYASAATMAAATSILFVTVITVLADLAPGLKDWLKVTFTHHWIGKGVIAAGLFVVVYLFLNAFLKKATAERLVPLLRLLTWLTVAGTIVILGFFVYEAF